jgi:sulfur-oxidizing protein SoxY
MTRHRDLPDHPTGQTGPSNNLAPARIGVFNRRDLLLRARTGSLILVFAPTALLPRAIAEDAAPEVPASASGPTQASAEETIRRLSRGTKPVPGKININIPEIAENGNIVPFSVTADSPMTDSDFVKSIHIVCSSNAQPHIGSFHFTSLSGQATVTSRMRLSKSQDVFVLVEHSTGQFVLAQRTVKVTIGGCGGS